jgi:hypothetical protein
LLEIGHGVLGGALVVFTMGQLAWAFKVWARRVWVSDLNFGNIADRSFLGLENMGGLAVAMFPQIYFVENVF